MGARRTFTQDWKVEAARPVIERRVSIAQAARDLEVHVNARRAKGRAYRADPVRAFPGVGQQAPEAAELTQLRREVARLKMELDIRKDAAVGSSGRCNSLQWEVTRVLDSRAPCGGARRVSARRTEAVHP